MIRDSEYGFTLVELAVVLVIIGLLIGGLAPLLINRLEATRLSVTRDRLGEVAQSFSLYVQRTGALPCAADPAVDPGNAAFGVAPAAPCGGGEREGIVPFKDLGLPLEMARDGWGRYFTYRLSPGFSDPGAPGQTCKQPPWQADNFDDDRCEWCTETGSPGSNLNVVDAGGNPVVTSGQVVVLILVSHGANGLGAFIVNGTDNRIAGAAPGSDEEENQDNDADFVDKGVEVDFDDMARWITRGRMYPLTGGEACY